MAESSDEQDPFNCSICLHLLSNPVTTACGHSFCMNCLNECWDREVQKGCYSCPQCRHTFIPRPALSRSTVLAEVVERMKREAPEAGTAPPALNFALSGDVECDVCTKTKLKSTCLACLASYCESHIQTHYTCPALKRHKLVNASPHLLNQICSQHDKLLELYCCRDQQLICMQCALINHQNHNMTSSAAERQNIESKGPLKKTLDALQMEMVQREKKVQELRQAMDSHKLSAQAAVENSEKVFTELINSMKRTQAKITEMIRAQQKAEVMKVEELMLTLEQDISDLRRRREELGQLSQVEDDIYFIQNFSSLSQYKCSNLSNISIRQHLTFDEIETVICKLISQLYDICKQEIVWISEKVPTVHITDNKKIIQYLPSQPKTREEFLIYSTELNLNPSSACKQLSVQNKSVSRRNRARNSYDPPSTYQVLCNESLSGRCYFEVQFGGTGCSIVFSYDMICNGGGTVIFGSNDRSCKFYFPAAKLSVTHNKQQTKSLLSKIGVFLDQVEGTVSFYNVSDEMILLHRMQTTFSQPLYLGFHLRIGEITHQ